MSINAAVYSFLCKILWILFLLIKSRSVNFSTFKKEKILGKFTHFLQTLLLLISSDRSKLFE